jgi:hypothetical protein
MIAWLNGVNAGVWKTLWITVSAVAHLVIVMGVMWGGVHWASKDAAMVPGAWAVFTVGGTGILLKWVDYWYLKHVAPPLGAILCHAIMILFAVAYIAVACNVHVWSGRSKLWLFGAAAFALIFCLIVSDNGVSGQQLQDVGREVRSS